MLDLNAIRGRQIVQSINKVDFIGISGLISTYRYAEKLVRDMRNIYPGAKIVLGGGGFSSAPEVYMEELQPNYGVVGEGEEAMLELVEGVNPGDIKGLVHWENGGIVQNPSRPPIKDLDSLPPTPFGLLEMQAYIRGSKYYPWAGFSVLATRGCPFGCRFCYKLFGRSIRYRSVGSMVNELETLKRDYAVEGLLFGDECLTARKSYILELCESIKPIDMRWLHYSRLDTLDEEMMIAMSGAGCETVGFGLESGSKRILEAMDKKLDLDQAKETITLARKHFKAVAMSMIFGFPGEDDDSLRETVEYLRPFGRRGSLFHLTPYPGTCLSFFGDWTTQPSLSSI
jgi:radical SAM superfamily enzyme YgiQ (UPF0313 family)